MGVPQIIVIAMMSMAVGMAWANHGRPRDDWNGWTVFASTAIQIALLYWGGFFS